MSAVLTPWVIRRAVQADSRVYEALMAGIFAENLPTLCPRASIPTDEEVRAWLAIHQGQGSALFLAILESSLVGTINLTQRGRPNLDHAAAIGLNVRADQRGRGVGRALLAHGLSWFESHPTLTRLELDVMTNNPGAIHLYQSFGFVKEGVRVAAVKKDSQYFDMILMARRKAGAA